MNGKRQRSARSLLFLLVLVSCRASEAPEVAEPTAKRVTGVVDAAVIDERRDDPVHAESPRRWAVRLLYRGCRGGVPGRYLHPDLASRLVESGYYEQNAATLADWGQRPFGIVGALACPEPTPLVVLSIGLGITGVNYSLLADHLVSKGYAVAIVDHPYGALSRLPSGEILDPNADTALVRIDEDPSILEDRIAAWTEDLLQTAAAIQWGEVGPREGPLRIDRSRVFAVGHSLGGAVALDACRNPSIRACVNMDGAPFGSETMRYGFKGQGLTLFSDPLYSDEDLDARGRTREQWEAMGSEIQRLWADLGERGGGRLHRASVSGTGHLSFSDAPLVMPSTITRFGGDPVLGERALEILATTLDAYLSAIVAESTSGATPRARWDEFVATSPEVTGR